MSDRNSGGFIWIMAAGLFFAAWLFDYSPFGNEASAYLQFRHCEDEKHELKCEWRNHTRQIHKVSFEQQSVVTLNSDGSIIKAGSCAVFDNNNWYCGSGNDRFGFTDGEFRFGDIRDITLRSTSKAEWWQVKLFGAEKIENTWY